MGQMAHWAGYSWAPYHLPNLKNFEMHSIYTSLSIPTKKSFFFYLKKKSNKFIDIEKYFFESKTLFFLQHKVLIPEKFL